MLFKNIFAINGSMIFSPHLLLLTLLLATGAAVLGKSCHLHDGDCAACVAQRDLLKTCHFALFSVDHASHGKTVRVEEGKCYDSGGRSKAAIKLPPPGSAGWARRPAQCPPRELVGLPTEGAAARGRAVVDAALSLKVEGMGIVWALVDRWADAIQNLARDERLFGSTAQKKLRISEAEWAALAAAQRRAALPASCRSVVVRNALAFLSHLTQRLEQAKGMGETPASCKAEALRAEDPPEGLSLDDLWWTPKDEDRNLLEFVTFRQAKVSQDLPKPFPQYTDRLSTLRRLRDRYACHAAALARATARGDAEADASRPVLFGQCAAERIMMEGGGASPEARQRWELPLWLPSWYHASGAKTSEAKRARFGQGLGGLTEGLTEGVPAWKEILQIGEIRESKSGVADHGVYMSSVPEIFAATGTHYGPVRALTPPPRRVWGDEGHPDSTPLSVVRCASQWTRVASK